VLVLKIVLLIGEQAPGRGDSVNGVGVRSYLVLSSVSFGSFLLFSTGPLQSFPNTVHSFVVFLFV